MLESSAPIRTRVFFWSRTVLPSLLWGLQTLRGQDNKAFKRLSFCQSLQIRKMMKAKRRPIEGSRSGRLEPWLDWHIRIVRTATSVARSLNLCVINKLSTLTQSWAAHIARFAQPGKLFHPLLALLLWRNSAWWHDQSLYNDLRWDVLKHARGIGRPRRWETQFSSNWAIALSSPVIA